MSDSEAIKHLIRSLPIDEQLKIVQDLLSESGFTVVFGGSSRTTAEVCINVYNAKDLDLTEVLHSLGSWVRSRRPVPENESNINNS